jgi:hypothetical protein
MILSGSFVQIWIGVGIGDEAVPPSLQWQARLGAIERLDLARLIDQQTNGMVRQIDIKAHDVAELGDELRVLTEDKLLDERTKPTPAATRATRTVAIGQVQSPTARSPVLF